MSATIHAVLLIPPDGDPQKLLAEGPCGARPPSLAEYLCATDLGCGHRWWQHRAIDAYPDCPKCREFPHGHAREKQHALVLAWEGRPVPEGIDRVERRGAWDDTAERCRQWLPGGRRFCTYIVPPDLGVTDFLDADGNEVAGRPEVSP